MNRNKAKSIARSGITAGQIKDMLRCAHRDGAANDSRSGVNPSFSKAVCFNILWPGHKDMDDEQVIKKTGDVMGAVNALHEFGDYWNGEVPDIRRRKKPTGEYVHHKVMDID